MTQREREITNTIAAAIRNPGDHDCPAVMLSSLLYILTLRRRLEQQADQIRALERDASEWQQQQYELARGLRWN